MKGIGEKFPRFQMKAVVSDNMKTAFKNVNNKTYKDKWIVLFFYPKDFTFVCPTEIRGFAEFYSEFQDREAQLLAVSIDSEFVHLAWRKKQ